MPRQLSLQSLRKKTAGSTFIAPPRKSTIACVASSPGRARSPPFEGRTCRCGPPNRRRARLRPGELAVQGDRLFVGSGGSTALELLELQPEGKKRMPARDFVHGYHPATGDNWRDNWEPRTGNRELILWPSLRPASPPSTFCSESTSKMPTHPNFCTRPITRRLSPADHGLATELVMGVLRWRSLLDDQIAQRSSLKLSKLDPEVLTCLRLAAYQLLYLDRVPQHAAVHESVELVKRARKRSAVPFVNAVLRKFSEDAEPPRPAIGDAATAAELASSFGAPAMASGAMGADAWPLPSRAKSATTISISPRPASAFATLELQASLRVRASSSRPAVFWRRHAGSLPATSLELRPFAKAGLRFRTKPRNS